MAEQHEKQFSRNEERYAKSTEMYNAYTNKQITESEWRYYVIQEMNGLFITWQKKNIANKHLVDECDLMQTVAMAVTENLAKYNPELGTLSNFLNSYINDAINQSIMNGRPMNTKYAYNKANKMDRIARQHGFDGYQDPNLSDVALEKLTGESSKTIKSIRNATSYTFCSLDKPNEDGDDLSNVIQATGMSPEEYVINKEKYNLLYEALEELSSYERWLIEAVYEENLSIRKIIGLLKQPGFIEKNFPDEKVYADNNSIVKTLNEIFTKLRQNKKLADYRPKETYDAYESTEQSSENFIFESFL